MSTQSKGGAAAPDNEKIAALQQMNLSKILKAYIKQMIDDVPGYKALLLDEDTMRICSTVFGRTELGEHNVVHIERIERDPEKRKPHQELQAICFLRPTARNISLLKKELNQQSYFQKYYLYFTNLTSMEQLAGIGEADAAKELVQTVQEFYGDFIVLDPHHFMVPVRNPEKLMGTFKLHLDSMAYDPIDHMVSGLSALFLAVRRKPVIRYQKGSDFAYRLADNLYSLIYAQQASVFDFGARSSPIVLILDRKDDPVTPLLTQWTYQAMIHEMIGINDNTVTLVDDSLSEEMRELVLDAEHDEFWRKHIYSNYADIAISTKELVDKHAKVRAEYTKATQEKSLEDMKRLAMEMSTYQRQEHNTSKHANLGSQLSKLIKARNLWEISTLEQELANPATGLTSSSAFEDTVKLVRASNTSNKDKARLVMLFALRFEQDSLRLDKLKEALVQSGVREEEPKLYSAVETMLRWAGSDQRAGDLYGSRTLLSKMKMFQKGFQGVESVYTQHTPLLSQTMAQLAQMSLPTASYPYVAKSTEETMALEAQFRRAPPQQVIIFIVGGTTYEEAKTVAEWNEKQGQVGQSDVRIILGGTDVLNSDKLLKALGEQAPSNGALEIRVQS